MGSPCMFCSFTLKPTKFSTFPSIRIVNHLVLYDSIPKKQISSSGSSLFNSFTLKSSSNFVHFFLEGQIFLIKNFNLLFIYFGGTKQDQDIKDLLLFYLSGLEKKSSLSESGSFGLKRSGWKCCRCGGEDQVVGNERR